MTQWLVRKAAHLRKFNPYHDDIGRFTTADGNTTGAEGANKTGRSAGADKPGSKRNPIKTSDVNEAIRHLADGKHVELESVEQVSTLLVELRNVVREASERGDKAKTYDLCRVSVPGTNVFCAEHKGIPRIKMPQLKGDPIKDSVADKMPRNKRGEVDLAEPYVKDLKKRGVKVTRETVKAAHLKASQSELVGAKVAGMLQAAKEGKFDLDVGEVFISRDGYIIDGHHRWATVVGMDASDDGKLGGLTMKVVRVGIPILEVLRDANDYANKMGIQAKVGKAQPHCVGCQTDWLARKAALLRKFNPYHDELGRFTTAGAAHTISGDLPASMYGGASHLAALASANGGFTFDQKRGRFRRSGNAVATFEELEAQFSLDEWARSGPQKVREYIAKNQGALSTPNAHVGAWKGERGGQEWVFLDVSAVVNSHKEAADLSRSTNQQAFWDLGEFVEYRRKDDNLYYSYADGAFLDPTEVGKRQKSGAVYYITPSAAKNDSALKMFVEAVASGTPVSTN